LPRCFLTSHGELRALAGVDARSQRGAGQHGRVDAADAEPLDDNSLDGRGRRAVEGEPLGDGLAAALQFLFERVVAMEKRRVDDVLNLKTNK